MKKSFIFIFSILLTVFFSACGGGSGGGGSSTVKMEIGKSYEVHTGDTLQKTSPKAVITVTRTQENNTALTKVVLSEGTATLTLH